MKKIKLFFLLFILCSNVTYAEEKLDPDITETQLQAIAAKFECDKPKNAVAEMGCQTLQDFSKASSPDPKLIESYERKESRWVGPSAIWGGPGKTEVKRPSPYLNLFLFCTRYTRDFHEKIYYPTAQALINIGPETPKEIDSIEKAVLDLRKGNVDRSTAVIQFAETYDPSTYYYVTEKTQGKSFINGGTYIRQKQDRLYFVDIAKDWNGKERYLISTISLGNKLGR